MCSFDELMRSSSMAIWFCPVGDDDSPFQLCLCRLLRACGARRGPSTSPTPTPALGVNLRRFGLEGLLIHGGRSTRPLNEGFQWLGRDCCGKCCRKETAQSFCGVVFGTRMETGAVDVEPSDCADAIGFAVEGISGGLGIGRTTCSK